MSDLSVSLGHFATRPTAPPRPVSCLFTLAVAAVLIAGCTSREDASLDPAATTTDQASDQPTRDSLPRDPQSPTVTDPVATPTNDRQQKIGQVEQLLQRGDFDAAAEKLRGLLVVDPDDYEVAFRLANVLASQGGFDPAIELLDSIPASDPQAGIPALGQAADWSAQLQRFDEAEKRYLKIVTLAPQLAGAHRKLAYLYNCQGRRHEAAKHIDELCRQGNVRQDELHSLIHLSDAMYDDPTRSSSSGGVQYFPIGVSAEARRLFMQREYQQAADVLAESIRKGQQPAAVVSLFGRAAAEAQDQEQLQWWLNYLEPAMQDHADYWAALGLHLIAQNQHEQAARALLEAVDRDPTDLRSISRLRSVMETLELNEQAELWEKRWMALRDTANQNNRVADASSPDVEAIMELAEMLDSLGRSLEAVLWRSIAAYHGGAPQDVLAELSQQLKSIVSQGDGFPSQDQRLCGMSLDRFPLPQLEGLIAESDAAKPSSTASEGPASAARFENVADQIGLEHRYQVGSSPRPFGFSVYQSVGGAVAAIDYDLNGHVDLYFTQGGADPPDFQGQMSNVLYRSSDASLQNVTENAAAGEQRYSIGATVGDWNQDGFPDLAISNIGANTLLINNGDGTFRRVSIDDRDDKSLMTTSLAMADLSGDGLPDLYEVNYLHDDDIARRPELNAQGEVIKSLMPQEFKPGLDRIVVNGNDGEVSFLPMGTPETDARAGLGIVVSDFDHRNGNEAFVGNDVYANQLWWRNPESQQWRDVGMLRGCAFGFDGVKTASMGIAAGDFDLNGWMDLHITNFQEESVSFFLNRDGYFQDRNIQFTLADASKQVLGFGSQAIDYDNDGRLDLAVANGHIEKTLAMPAPFEQPAQLFSNRGDRFELIAVEDETNYWSGLHLGRGMARLDWNRDGAMDLAITHLGETSALLINRTDVAKANHWLQLELRGVASERDAIGARVTLKAGDRQWTEWITAGDGFLSRNEQVVAFGLGEIDRVDSITINWPSGEQQEFEDLTADQRLMVVEDQKEVFKVAPVRAGNENRG